MADIDRALSYNKNKHSKKFEDLEKNIKSEKTLELDESVSLGELNQNVSSGIHIYSD
jgi:hypothetical protein